MRFGRRRRRAQLAVRPRTLQAPPRRLARLPLGRSLIVAGVAHASPAHVGACFFGGVYCCRCGARAARQPGLASGARRLWLRTTLPRLTAAHIALAPRRRRSGRVVYAQAWGHRPESRLSCRYFQLAGRLAVAVRATLERGHLRTRILRATRCVCVGGCRMRGWLMASGAGCRRTASSRMLPPGDARSHGVTRNVGRRGDADRLLR